MRCPACLKTLPLNLERGYSKHGIHHGSICPYCRAHFRAATPLWVFFALILAGWTALEWAVHFVHFSEPIHMLIGVAWLAAVAIWFTTRPKVVIPKEECAE
jgi:hypothetical protein